MSEYPAQSSGDQNENKLCNRVSIGSGVLADVDIIFEHAIIILIAFELDHLRTLGHKLLKRTKLQMSELGRCDGHYNIQNNLRGTKPRDWASLRTTSCL